jgi:transcriptional regulator with XRE-family HTH domain
MSAAEQIRYHRQSRNISLRSLAKEAGISASSLSKIESGKAKLTVEMAVKLAGILHVPASIFLLEQAPQALARRTITRSDMGEVHHNPGMSLEVLCSDFKEKRNLFWKVKVIAKSIDECGGMRQHPGQEFLYILAGTLEIHSAFYDTCTLKTGDSILFDADQPHAYVAPDGHCELVMMNSISSPN